MTTVMIVDDHPIVRAGLSELLSSADGIDLVGAVGSGEEAVALAERLSPAIVLMDINLPGMDGIEATKAITEQNADIAVVILTTFDDASHMDRAILAGARGYLRKDVPPQALLASIRTAADTWVSFLPGVDPPLLNGGPSPLAS